MHSASALNYFRIYLLAENQCKALQIETVCVHEANTLFFRSTARNESKSIVPRTIRHPLITKNRTFIFAEVIPSPSSIKPPKLLVDLLLHRQLKSQFRLTLQNLRSANFRTFSPKLKLSPDILCCVMIYFANPISRRLSREVSQIPAELLYFTTTAILRIITEEMGGDFASLALCR